VSPLLVEAGPAVAQVAVPVQNPEPPPGQGAEFGKASPVALVVILALAVVTVLLIRSMSKHIRRLPGSFDAPDEQAPESAPEEAPRPKEKAGGDPAEPGSS
jgi:hypothetical protein